MTDYAECVVSVNFCGACHSLACLAFGSKRFARFDWTGMRLA